MASIIEAELGGLFENFPKLTSIWTALSETGHPQPPTVVATDNLATHSIVNDTTKQKISRAIDMRFYWVSDWVRQDNFHIFWEAGKKNLTGHFTKNHLFWHHRTMRPRILKAKQKGIENPNDQKTRNVRGCAGTSNPRVTRKPDNTLEGIHNLVPNVTRNQWPHGLDVPN